MTPNNYQALAFRTAPCPDSTTRSEMHGVFDAYQDSHRSEGDI